jgi:putative FmdB family regulatory protein
MPTYRYFCIECTSSDEERNVPMAERDAQLCATCQEPLVRKLTFTGIVYANTANGGMK